MGGWAGLKQAKLARQVGVTQSAVQQWETDSTEPTHAHLEAIAKACGVELRIFFGDIGEADDVERAS